MESHFRGDKKQYGIGKASQVKGQHGVGTPTFTGGKDRQSTRTKHGQNGVGAPTSCPVGKNSKSY